MDFTPEQQEAIQATRSLVTVSAGAGSGKTTILIERIARLLANAALWPDGRAQLDRIAAITFTDKAAAEMKARLRKKFRDYPGRDNPEQMHFWREMERQVESSRITTIHSFCASLLREHALHIGMDPDWAVLSEAESAQLTERVVKDVLHRLLEQEDAAAERLSLAFPRTQLTGALEQAVQLRWKYGNEDIRRQCGDAETLFHHWEAEFPRAWQNYLHILGAAPEANRLLEELKRYEGKCSNPADKRELQRAAYGALFETLCQGDPSDLVPRMQDALETFPRMSGSKKAWSDSDFNGVGEIIKEAKAFLKEACLPPEWDPEFERKAAQLTCDFYAVARQVIAAHAEARQSRAVIDYDDMISETVRMLRESKALRECIARSFRYLLIDEFQDTDPRQYETAQLLASVQGGPDRFIVGDVKQSIYLFRGAEVSLFIGERDQDPHAIALSTNYRSLPDLIHFINDFFQRSQLLASVEEYVPMNTHRPAMEQPRVEIFIPLTDTDGSRPSASDALALEAKYIAHRIREMCLGPTPLQLQDRPGEGYRPAAFDDIVLLFRRGTNMYAYESALRDAGIPYIRIAGEGFFRRREIMDMLALLKLVQDPWDEEALVTLLRSPLVGLSDEDLMRMTEPPMTLANAFHQERLPDALSHPDALEAGRALYRACRQQRESAPGALLRFILDQTHLEAVLLSQHLGLQRVSNLRKLVQLADAFRRGKPATLAEFTHYIEDMTVRELREGEAVLQTQGLGAVTLMTIHKSKGLEFPIVFIPEMNVSSGKSRHSLASFHSRTGIALKIPDADGELSRTCTGELIHRLNRMEEAEELARVLYVAMTRARDYLVLCGTVQAKKNTWAAALNECYALDSRCDGEVLTGGGWQAGVRRSLPVVPSSLAMTFTEPTLDVHALAAALEPIVPKQGGVDSISVSSLLKWMARQDLAELEFEPSALPEQEYGSWDVESALLHRNRAMRRGSMVHRLFECWNFKEDALPPLTDIIEETRLGLKQADALRAQLEAIACRFRESEWMPRFRNARNIQRETPFLLRIEMTGVYGVIDALVEDDLIVDYKTGRRNPEHERHYERQILLYAAAQQILCGQLPRRGVLWYADEGVAHCLEITEEKVRNIIEEARAALLARSENPRAPEGTPGI